MSKARFPGKSQNKHQRKLRLSYKDTGGSTNDCNEIVATATNLRAVRKYFPADDDEDDKEFIGWLVNDPAKAAIEIKQMCMAEVRDECSKNGSTENVNQGRSKQIAISERTQPNIPLSKIASNKDSKCNGNTPASAVKVNSRELSSDLKEVSTSENINAVQSPTSNRVASKDFNFLPGQSTRSSRVITPNKKYSEDAVDTKTNTNKRARTDGNRSLEGYSTDVKPVLNLASQRVLENGQVPSDSALRKSSVTDKSRKGMRKGEPVKLPQGQQKGKRDLSDKKTIDINVQTKKADTKTDSDTFKERKIEIEQENLYAKRTELVGACLAPSADKKTSVSNGTVEKSDSIIVCGICRKIRQFKVPTNNYKFGVFLCDRCYDQSTKAIKKINKSKSYSCLDGKGLCLSQPEMIPEGSCCDACFSKYCLLTMDLSDDIYFKIWGLIPESVRGSLEPTPKYIFDDYPNRGNMVCVDKSGNIISSKPFRSNTKVLPKAVGSSSSTVISTSAVGRTSDLEIEAPVVERGVKRLLPNDNLNFKRLKAARVKQVSRCSSIIPRHPVATWKDLDTLPSTSAGFLRSGKFSISQQDNVADADEEILFGRQKGTVRGRIKILVPLEMDSIEEDGFPIVVTGPFPPKPLCFLCGSAGIEQLIFCAVCCEPYHPFCAGDDTLMSYVIKTIPTQRSGSSRGEESTPSEIEKGMEVLGTNLKLSLLSPPLTPLHFINEIETADSDTDSVIDEGLREHVLAWTCRKCIICKSCGLNRKDSDRSKSNDFIKCTQCRDPYHLACVSKKGRKEGSWSCPNCCKCKSCGKNLEGNKQSQNVNVSVEDGGEESWGKRKNNLLLCLECFKKRQNGSFCPACQVCYDENDYDTKMMECAKCERWIHATCESISDEQYEILGTLPDCIEYICRVCDRENTIWRRAIMMDMISGCERVLRIFQKNAITSSRKRKSLTSVLKDFESSKMEIFLESEIAKPSESTNVEKVIEPAVVEDSEQEFLVKPLLWNSSMEEDDPIETLCMNEVEEETSEIIHKGVEEGTAEEGTAIEQKTIVNKYNGLVEEKVQIPENIDLRKYNLKSCKVVLKDTFKKKVKTCSVPLTDIMKCPKTELTKFVGSLNPKIVDLLQSGGFQRSPTKGNHYPTDEMKLRTPTKVNDFPADAVIDSCTVNTPKKMNDVPTDVNTPTKINSFPTHEIVAISAPKTPTKTTPCKVFTPTKPITVFSERIKNLTAITVFRSINDFRKEALYLLLQTFQDIPEFDNTKFQNLVAIFESAVKEVFPSLEIEEIDVNNFSVSQNSTLYFDPETEKFKHISNANSYNTKFDKNQELNPFEDTYWNNSDLLDERLCSFCGEKGDFPADSSGRLLWAGSNEWVHTNCAIWSSEVFEDDSGALKQVGAALLRSKNLKCVLCQKKGASVSCCHSSCHDSFHFLCSIKAGCALLEDKSLLCPDHVASAKYDIQEEMQVMRKVFVDVDWLRKKGCEACSSEVKVSIGSLRIEQLGYVVPISVTKVADPNETILVPLDYKCYRLYWSQTNPVKKILYSFETGLNEDNFLPTANATGDEFNMTVDHCWCPDYVETKLNQIQEFHSWLENAPRYYDEYKTEWIPPCPLNFNEHQDFRLDDLDIFPQTHVIYYESPSSSMQSFSLSLSNGSDTTLSDRESLITSQYRRSVNPCKIDYDPDFVSVIHDTKENDPTVSELSESETQSRKQNVETDFDFVIPQIDGYYDDDSSSDSEADSGETEETSDTESSSSEESGQESTKRTKIKRTTRQTVSNSKALAERTLRSRVKQPKLEMKKEIHKCPGCKKPFQSKSSVNRHTRFCKSKSKKSDTSQTKRRSEIKRTSESSKIAKPRKSGESQERKKQDRASVSSSKGKPKSPVKKGKSKVPPSKVSSNVSPRKSKSSRSQSPNPSSSANESDSEPEGLVAISKPQEKDKEATSNAMGSSVSNTDTTVKNEIEADVDIENEVSEAEKPVRCTTCHMTYRTSVSYEKHLISCVPYSSTTDDDTDNSVDNSATAVVELESQPRASSHLEQKQQGESPPPPQDSAILSENENSCEVSISPTATVITAENENAGMKNGERVVSIPTGVEIVENVEENVNVVKELEAQSSKEENLEEEPELSHDNEPEYKDETSSLYPEPEDVSDAMDYSEADITETNVGDQTTSSASELIDCIPNDTIQNTCTSIITDPVQPVVTPAVVLPSEMEFSQPLPQIQLQQPIAFSEERPISSVNTSSVQIPVNELPDLPGQQHQMQHNVLPNSSASFSMQKPTYQQTQNDQMSLAPKEYNFSFPQMTNQTPTHTHSVPIPHPVPTPPFPHQHPQHGTFSDLTQIQIAQNQILRPQAAQTVIVQDKTLGGSPSQQQYAFTQAQLESQQFLRDFNQIQQSINNPPLNTTVITTPTQIESPHQLQNQQQHQSIPHLPGQMQPQPQQQQSIPTSTQQFHTFTIQDSNGQLINVQLPIQQQSPNPQQFQMQGQQTQLNNPNLQLQQQIQFHQYQQQQIALQQSFQQQQSQSQSQALHHPSHPHQQLSFQQSSQQQLNVQQHLNLQQSQQQQLNLQTHQQQLAVQQSLNLQQLNMQNQQQLTIPSQSQQLGLQQHIPIQQQPNIQQNFGGMGNFRQETVIPQLNTNFLSNQFQIQQQGQPQVSGALVNPQSSGNNFHPSGPTQHTITDSTGTTYYIVQQGSTLPLNSQISQSPQLPHHVQVPQHDQQIITVVPSQQQVANQSFTPHGQYTPVLGNSEILQCTANSAQLENKSTLQHQHQQGGSYGPGSTSGSTVNSAATAHPCPCTRCQTRVYGMLTEDKNALSAKFPHKYGAKPWTSPTKRGPNKNTKSQLANMLIDKKSRPLGSNFPKLLPATVVTTSVTASSSTLTSSGMGNSQSDSILCQALGKTPISSPNIAVVRPMEHPLQKLSEQVSQMETSFNSGAFSPGNTTNSVVTPPLPISSAIQQSTSQVSGSPIPVNTTQAIPTLSPGNPSAVIPKRGKAKSVTAVKRKLEPINSPCSEKKDLIKLTLQRKEGDHKYSIKNRKGGSEVSGLMRSLKIKGRITTGGQAGTNTDIVVLPMVYTVPTPDPESDVESNVTIAEDEIASTLTAPHSAAHSGGSDKTPARLTHRAVILYEVKCEDTVLYRSSDVNAVWRHIFETVQGTRVNNNLPPLSYPSINLPWHLKQGEPMAFSKLGLTHRAMQFLLDQLPFANSVARTHHFEHHEPPHDGEDVLNQDNNRGCARTEPYSGRKAFDMFGWLASKHRNAVSTIQYTDDVKSQGLPIAMRYRNLKEKARTNLTVYRSKIHGRGLYTRREIQRGDMIIEYAGEVIRSLVCDEREKYYECKGIGCYFFRMNDDFVVDATMRGNAARFINHSCEPNCEAKCEKIWGKMHILIYALRRINQGEELMYDYKFNFEDEEDKIPCTCGSKKCRKYLN